MPRPFRSFLIIQTAFIGDVILATGLIEKIHQCYPEASIDFLLRKGNEGLLSEHPLLRRVLIWDKKESKIKNLLALIGTIRTTQYDCVINVHRFASSGLITALSGSALKIGFDSNPLSFTFSRRIKHEFGKRHEVERNHQLIEAITDAQYAKPRLYPAEKDFEKVQDYQKEKYFCIAPTSVWFTKQFPEEKWVTLIKSVSPKMDSIYLLGAPSDNSICEHIRTASACANVVNLAGQLTFLESAALIKNAAMNFVNDSAPMHIASAMNAPVTAVYCSTVPSFGYGPLSDRSIIVETTEKLDCRPCGIHGFKACPLGHFKCAFTIADNALLNAIR